MKKIHIVGVSLGAVLAQDFANRYPYAVSSLACFGGYDINNFDNKMQKKNGAKQMLLMLKALFSVKWFAKANKKISAYTSQAQNELFAMNILFPKKSFMFLATLSNMVNQYKTEKLSPILPKVQTRNFNQRKRITYNSYKRARCLDAEQMNLSILCIFCSYIFGC